MDLELTIASIVAMLGSRQVRDENQLYAHLPAGVYPNLLLYELWRKGEWASLLFFSSQGTGIAPLSRMPPYTLAAQKCRGCCGQGSAWLPCLYLPDPLGRHLVAFCCDKGNIGSAALVLQGAAMMEMGYVRAGSQLIQWYVEHYEDKETRNFAGVARLYLARFIAWRSSKEGRGWLLEGEEREYAAALLDEAADCFGDDAEALHRLQLVRDV